MQARDRQMAKRTATCSCGNLRVTARGEPIRISICHCLECQRRTGSVFGAQARFEAGSLKISGESSRYIRTADSGDRVYLFFCPHCGNTVYYQLEADMKVIAIPIGAFADPQFPKPGYSVYEARRHDWVQIPADSERSS